ncbi:MAG: hypothetical protein OXC66_12095, partial [Roseovarius sp.]|nr:hypothetical protein [Roseovarius sp.]
FWRWIWSFGPVRGGPPRTGDGRAVASGATFQCSAKVEVELGWVICERRGRSATAARRESLLV